MVKLYQIPHDTWIECKIRSAVRPILHEFRCLYAFYRCMFLESRQIKRKLELQIVKKLTKNIQRFDFPQPGHVIFIISHKRIQDDSSLGTVES